MMRKIVFHEMPNTIDVIFEPYETGYVNDTAIRTAKVEGEYRWHTHLREDEFFMVIKGKVFIDTESPDGTVELNEMEGYIVPKGTRHRSRTDAGEPAWIILVEPTRTRTKG